MTTMRFNWLRHFCTTAGLASLAVLVPTMMAFGQRPATPPVDGIRDLGIATTAIEGAKVVLEPGVIRDNYTVVIREGKIIDMGDKVQLPPGTEKVDGKGKTIYAGFIDAYTEAEVPATTTGTGSPYWNSQITPERNVATLYQPSAEKMSKYRKAGVTAMLVAPSTGIVKGTSCVVAALDDNATSALLRSKVADHVRLTVARRFGGGGGGSTDGGYPSSPMGAVALARQAFLDAQWYRQAWQAYRAQPSLPQPENNSALQALVDSIDQARPFIFDTGNEQYAMRADQFAREFGLPAILRGSGREYRLLDVIQKLNRAIIVPVNFPKAPDVSMPALADDVTLQDLMHWELAPENPGRLAAAGIPFTITTDGLSEPTELLDKVREAIERGLDGNVALKALTTEPARMLGIDDVAGSIQLGKWASFVVTDGDLWDKKTKIVETWVQGRRYQWDEAPTMEWKGKWNLTLTANGEYPTALELSVEEGKRPAATLTNPNAPKEAPAEEKKSDDKKPEEKPADASAEAKPAEEAKPEEPKADADAAAAEAKPEAKSDAKPDEGGEGRRGRGRGGDEKTPANASKLAGIKLQDLRLAGTFDAKPLHKAADGKAQIAITSLTDGDKQKLVGSVVWPDGSISQLVGELAPKEEKKEEAQPQEDKSPSDKSEPAADSDKKSDEAKPAADAKPAEGETKKPDADKKADAEKKEADSKKVLSQVNYPFGEYGRSGLPTQSEWVLIQHATIWTSADAGTLQDSDMLIHNGIIAEIGKGLTAPEGAVVIDATGRHVSAGIIDCHSHMATDGGVNEGSQSVTAEVRVGDFIDAEDISIYRQMAGGVTTSNILHGSANPIGGQNQVIKLRWGGVYDDLKMREAPAGVKFALGENVKRSGATRTEGPVRYPASRMGVDEIYRDRFEAAREYDRQWKMWNENPKGLPPRRDLELEAIAQILRKERWIHCHSYRQDEILAFLRMLEDFNVQVGSLQHILEGYKVADAMAKHGAMASSFSDWWAYKVEVWDAIPHNGAILHNMGIVVSFNSDDAELARHLNHEAAKAVKYGGVPPEEALKFVTLNPAKQLRIDQYVGSLEVGKHADFVIWNASPLSPMSRCEQTWIDGRKYFDREEDKTTQSAISELRTKLIQKVLAGGGEMAGPGERPFDPSAEWPRHDEFCHHHDDEDHAYHLHLLDQEHAHEHE